MNTTLLFTPATPFEKCLCAGDAEGALTLLDTFSVDERTALLPRLRTLERLADEARFAAFSAATKKDPQLPALRPWGASVDAPHMKAVGMACIACGHFGGRFEPMLLNDDLLMLAMRFRRTGLAAHVPQHPMTRAIVVQQLYREGLAEVPTSDNFVLGLMHLPARSGTRINLLRPDTRDWRADLDALLSHDPGLAPRLLRMFDLEGNSDVSLAHSDKYYSHPGRTWADKLLDLCQQGVFTRAQLLAKVLEALSHDWPQYRSGWHSRFHDALAPSAEEMRPFADRYLALCHSRIPPTVALALNALKGLASENAVEADALLAALLPVMNAGVKAQIAAALKLLDSVVKREPAQAAAAAALACRALQLNDASTQAQVLQRLQRWPLDAEARAVLTEMRTHISAQHHAAVDALLGAPLPATASVHIASPHSPNPNDHPRDQAGNPALPQLEFAKPDQDLSSQKATTPPALDPLDPSRRLPDITELDELIEACARVLSGEENIDLFEQVLQALVRQAPLTGDALRAFGPVLKQAQKARTPLAQELAFLITSIARVQPAKRERPSGPVNHRLRERIAALVELAADPAMPGRELGPLSCATHSCGVIDPATLVQRAAAMAEAGIAAPIADQRDALLRLLPGANPAVQAAADGLPPSGFARALRYALGCDIGPPVEAVLAIAAARIRHAGTDDELLLAKLGDIGPDGPRHARFQWSVEWIAYEVDGKSYPYYKLQISAGKVPRDTPDEWWPVSAHMPTGLENGSSEWAAGGESPDLVAYYASLQPSSLQTFFAEGARLIGNYLQYTEVAKHLRAYLAPLLDPTVTLGPMGHLLLAVALGEREATRAALAVDGLLAAAAQQRLQWPALIQPLQQLLWQRVVTPPRLLRNLQSAAQRDAAALQATFKLLCGLCATPPQGDAPKGFANLLSLLLDLATSLQQALPASTRDGLPSLQAGSSAEAVRRRLLALPA